MNRLISISISMGLCLIGFTITALILYAVGRVPELNIFKVVAGGFVLGAIECIFIHRYASDNADYLRLDGAIFPFVSLGATAAMVIL
jgi:hypothetical protein